MGVIEMPSFEESSWLASFRQAQRKEAICSLERGGLLFFPYLAFRVRKEEQFLFAPGPVHKLARNVSLEMDRSAMRGCVFDAAQAEALQGMMQRYARTALELIRSLLPYYAQSLRHAGTSYRPVEACSRTGDWRCDDGRLHIDAFASSPTGGKRLLRVFNNINPHGRDRLWRVGETFEAVANRFLPSIARPWPGSARLMRALGVTKGPRTEYDHIMLQIHDRMTADSDYQGAAVRADLRMVPGSTWITMTDCVSHAVVSGQYVMEQTFLLPVAGMRDPQLAPLRVLERLAGRPLA
jgi:hypothetical protein